MSARNPALAARIQATWFSAGTASCYLSEADLQGHLRAEFNQLIGLLPSPSAPPWPEKYLTQAPGRQFRVTTHSEYSDTASAVIHDITISMQTIQYYQLPRAPDTWQIPFFLAEVKTEPAIVEKLQRVREILAHGGQLERCNDAADLPQGDRMLLQVWVQLVTSGCSAGLLIGSNTLFYVQAQNGYLYLDGPYYRHPLTTQQQAFKPVDAFRLMLRSYLALLSDTSRLEALRTWWMVCSTPVFYLSVRTLHLSLSAEYEAIARVLPSPPVDYYPRFITDDPTCIVEHSTLLSGNQRFGTYFCVRTIDLLAGLVKVTDYKFFVVEVESERTLSAELDNILAIATHGRLAPSDDVTNLPIANRILLRLWERLHETQPPVGILTGENTVFIMQREDDILHLDGPYYRSPTNPDQKEFTPLDALQLMVRSFVVRGELEARAIGTRQGDANPAVHCLPRLLPLRQLSDVISPFRRIFNQVQLATCRKLRVQYPPENGRVVDYRRTASALTGSLVASRGWSVVQTVAHFAPITAVVKLTAPIGGGHDTMTWRGHLGEAPVVVKMNRYLVEDGHENRVIAEEWSRLERALPHDVRMATALPIPAYHGLFVGVDNDIILMSDCGDSLADVVNGDDNSLRSAHNRALDALRSAGIEPEDVAPRNAVYDGRVVRIIDFV
ncbi:hypothetical protein FKP32DRAFT_1679075 [Trametes sanguinea]|nr:hypothetical protein FKP32DRAFT_1679075 [Trametes sanguinea]